MALDDRPNPVERAADNLAAAVTEAQEEAEEAAQRAEAASNLAGAHAETIESAAPAAPAPVEEPAPVEAVTDKLETAADKIADAAESIASSVTPPDTNDDPDGVIDTMADVPEAAVAAVEEPIEEVTPTRKHSLFRKWGAGSRDSE